MEPEGSEVVLAAALLSRRAELTPERIALLDDGTGATYTYRQLNERANRLATGLCAFGVGKGDRVCLLSHNGVAYVDLLYGLAKIGAIFAPLNWRLTPAEQAQIVRDCEPAALIYGPESAATAVDLRREVGIPILLSLEGTPVEGALSYEDLLAAAEPDEPERPFLTGEDTCCLLYTSGTTGRPKGAMIPQRQVVWNAINTAISWGLSEADVAPILTPMFHAGGLFVFLTPLLYAGGRVVLARTFDSTASLMLIERERCTVVLGVPTLFRIWMADPVFASIDFSTVRFFISGGAPCPVSLISAWREATGCVLRQGYGLTEAGVNCFTMTDEEAVRHAGTVGKPIFHSRIRIVDGDGRDVAPGTTGELLIGGPHVYSGYWRNPEATAAALRDGWLHTGDMALRDADGMVTIAGRFKDMIISGGENIYAAEVEAAFLDHPAVAEAALIGVPDERWGEVGWMVIVLRSGQRVTAEELLDFCGKRLARYKAPKRVLFVAALPTSPYGKVMKAELRRLLTGG